MFDFGRLEVLRFLLSNLCYFATVFRVDGVLHLHVDIPCYTLHLATPYTLLHLASPYTLLRLLYIPDSFL